MMKFFLIYTSESFYKPSIKCMLFILHVYFMIYQIYLLNESSVQLTHEFCQIISTSLNWAI